MKMHGELLEYLILRHIQIYMIHNITMGLLQKEVWITNYTAEKDICGDNL